MFRIVKNKIKNLLNGKNKKEIKSDMHKGSQKPFPYKKKKPSQTAYNANKNQAYKKKTQTGKNSSSNLARQTTVKNYPRNVEKKIPVKLPELVAVPLEKGKTRFSDFDLQNEILCGLQDAEFKYCTPVQEECIPNLLLGKDIAGKAQTGTGKTAAFLISIFYYLLKHPLTHKAPGMCRVLIIAPTRELAMQIHKDAEKLGKYCGFNNLVVYGGEGYKKQQSSLGKHIDILVGTPGRLLDYAGSRYLKLSNVEMFVIDEADRMLDMGFIPSVRRIVRQLPPAGQRQTMLFSATLSGDVLRLIKNWQVEPVMVEIRPEQIVAEPIEQVFYSVLQNEKKKLLLWLLKNDDIKKVLIFVNRRDFTQNLKGFLLRSGQKPEVLSGDIPQYKRVKILEDFRQGAINILIATDVASRGIHVDDVSHVINYDLPEKAEDYIHRIGRTGRAGRQGKSISFLCEFGSYVIPDLEKILETEIKSIQPETYMINSAS